MLQHITSWSYRHRWLVVVAWVAVLVSVNLAGSMFGGESKQEFLSPGTDSKAAVELLDERFPDRAGDTVTVVVHDDEGVGSEAVRSVAEPVVDRFRALPHVVDVVSPWDAAGAGQVSADGTTAYAVVQLDTTGARFPVDVASDMVDLAADARAAGVQMELSGQAIENVQASSMGAEGPGLAIAALILLIAFGSLVAMGLPLATALFGVGIGLAGGKLIANVIDVPEWASSVAIMIGLGVGIDYALLILTRYRSELDTRRRAPAGRGHRHGHRGQVRRLRRRHRRHLAARHADHEPALRPGRRLLRGPDRGRGDAGGPDPAARADRLRRSQHRPAADPVPAPLPGHRRSGLLAPLQPLGPAPPDPRRRWPAPPRWACSSSRSPISTSAIPTTATTPPA